MIDWFLKRYFYGSSDDLVDRKFRVWQKIYAHIRAESELTTAKTDAVPGFRFAWVPLVVTLALVGLGASAAGIFRKVSPEEAYSLLREATDGTKVASSDSQQDENFDFEFIFQRAEEVIQLENKAKTDGRLTPDEKERIVKAKTEIGQRALALSKTADEAVKSDSTADQLAEAEANELILVEAAEAELVGEAVLQLVRSSAAGNGQADSGQLTQKIKEVVKTMETAETSDTRTDGGVAQTGGDNEQVDQGSETGGETGDNTGAPSSILKEEVDSGEVQIK